eukprot:scaffold5618_cov309-Chaetoceros_neogracile.AAC.1
MLPTQEPSSSPSKSNSKEPSQGPNDQSSTEPTRLQSQEPSSDPSVEPSLLPSGDRSKVPIILCPEEKSATGLNTTVGDVKSAVEHLLFSLTNGTFIATLASNNTGVDIALSSIALSQPLDFKSEHFITQIEVQGALQTLVEAIDDIDEVRIGAFDKLASSLAGGSLLDFLVGEMDRIAILKEDYVNFLDSRSNETKATREHFTDKFRHIYSYACGDSYANVTIGEGCDIADLGTCSFGGVNVLRSDLFPFTHSDESRLEVFEDWIISAMVEISLLVTVCLPIDLDPCTALIDDVLEEDEINFLDMIDGYDE